MAKNNTTKKNNSGKKKTTSVQAKKQVKDMKKEKVSEEVKNTSQKSVKSKTATKADVKKQTLEKARRELHFEKNNSSDEFSNLVKVVLIVTAIIIVFYFITTFVTRKANAVRTVRNLKTNEKAEIQYDSLIIGSMLNLDGSYYVLIEKDDDAKLTEYQTLLQTIAANDEAPKIYTANLTDSFNKVYLADEHNYDSDLTKFKVTGTVLVKVNDHKIDLTYDNYDDIVKKLEELK